MTTSSTNDSVEKFADWDACVTNLEGDVEMAKSMFKLLVVELTDSAAQLKTILKNKDTKGLAALSHKLRGSCVYCGIVPLSEQCLRIEKHLLADPASPFEAVSALGEALLVLIDATLRDTLSILDVTPQLP